jgi:hypothetical protein
MGEVVSIHRIDAIVSTRFDCRLNPRRRVQWRGVRLLVDISAPNHHAQSFRASDTEKMPQGSMSWQTFRNPAARTSSSISA